MSPSTKDPRDTLTALFGEPRGAQRKRAQLAASRVALLAVGALIEDLQDQEQALRRTHERLLREVQRSALKGGGR